MCIFTLETPGYDFPRAPQNTPQVGPKGFQDTTFAVSIDWIKRRPVSCQQPVGEVVWMYTYTGQGLTKEKLKVQSTEATDGPLMDLHAVYSGSSMQASV